ncbi:MAG: choice-of-anchor E domain-containing protein [Methanothrix sp.]|nr:choice-of-anchor E domain-containing protein [Methanothrix sp.]
MISIKFALLSSLILIITFTGAGAEDLIFCDSVPLKNTNWADNFTLPKFDPEMGVLKAVEIDIDVNMTLNTRAENLDKSNSSSSISSAAKSELVLILPNSEEIKANASLATSRDLPPFDGVNDFSGPSGLNLTESASSGTANYRVQDVSGFVAASPGEVLHLRGELGARRRTDSSSGVSSNFRILAGAKVCVSYLYDAMARDKGDRT